MSTVDSTKSHVIFLVMLYCPGPKLIFPLCPHFEIAASTCVPISETIPPLTARELDTYLVCIISAMSQRLQCAHLREQQRKERWKSRERDGKRQRKRQGLQRIERKQPRGRDRRDRCNEQRRREAWHLVTVTVKVARDKVGTTSPSLTHERVISTQGRPSKA